VVGARPDLRKLPLLVRVGVVDVDQDLNGPSIVDVGVTERVVGVVARNLDFGGSCSTGGGGVAWRVVGIAVARNLNLGCSSTGVGDGVTVGSGRVERL
jgi:hypothetical protein